MRLRPRVISASRSGQTQPTAPGMTSCTAVTSRFAPRRWLERLRGTTARFVTACAEQDVYDWRRSFIDRGATAAGGSCVMPHVRANGIDLHFRIDGTADQTVLMINGVGDDLEGWAFQRDEIAGAGLRVVTFDNRGC